MKHSSLRYTQICDVDLHKRVVEVDAAESDGVQVVNKEIVYYMYVYYADSESTQCNGVCMLGSVMVYSC